VVAAIQKDDAQRRSLINLRVTPRDRDLIDRAAATLGKNRSEFMMDATRMAAEDALLDRTAFRLDAERFSAFMAQLDAPPAPNAALKYSAGPSIRPRLPQMSKSWTRPAPEMVLWPALWPDFAQNIKSTAPSKRTRCDA